MKLHRKAAAALTTATLGTALLSTAPAHAGIKVPQGPHPATIILEDTTSYPPGPTVVGAGADADDTITWPPGPTVVSAGVIIHDSTSYPPGPTATSDTTTYPPGPSVVSAGVIIHDATSFPPGPTLA